MFNTSATSCSLRLTGSSCLLGPVCLTFRLRGLADIRTNSAKLFALADLLIAKPRWIKRSRRQNCLRDALIALDGRAANASYRDIATAVAGAEPSRGAWTKTNRSLKDRMHRALKAGAGLCDGGYRTLISQ